jgi:hypothetical protein
VNSPALVPGRVQTCGMARRQLLPLLVLAACSEPLPPDYDEACRDRVVDPVDEQPDRPGTQPDGDCDITLEEFRNNSAVSSLGAPDVNLFDGNELGPRTDDTKDCLSVGVAFTAVRAEVAP